MYVYKNFRYYGFKNNFYIIYHEFVPNLTFDFEAFRHLEQ